MIGTTISHFKITAKLGEGGMGEVYLAEDTDLKRKVALRVLPAELVESPERLGRFQREAESLAALNHPNIVHVFSVEVDQEGDSAVHFLTMELVEGESLEELIPEGGLPLGQVLDLAIPLADALAEAHERGIVHRDLKPAKVVVDGRGTPKILDFGLAKIRQIGSGSDSGDSASATQIEQDADLETMAYMSPEQVQERPVDQRSDLFSFGAILYELLTGRRAFEGESSAGVAGAVTRDSPPPLKGSRSGLPRAVQALVDRCLEKDPEARPAAAEVRTALEEIRTSIAPTYRRPVSVWFRDQLWSTPGRRLLVSAFGLATLVGASIWIGRGVVASRESAATEEDPVAETPSPAKPAIRRGNLFTDRYSFDERPEAFDLALAAYQEALDLDPDHPETPALIASLYLHKMRYGGEVSSLMPEAESWARRAVELDPDSDLTLNLLWNLERVRVRPNHREILEAETHSRKRMRRAFEIDPYTLSFYSFVLGNEGYRHELRIDPTYVWGFVNRAIILVALGRPEEALGVINEIVLLEPDFLGARRMKARTLIRLGRFDEARELIETSTSSLPSRQAQLKQIEFEMALEMSDTDVILENLSTQQAELLGAEMSFTERWRYRAPVLIESLASNGYAEEALDLMSQMHEAGFGEPPYDWLRLSPLFDPIRDDPRFQAVEAQAKENFDLMMEYLDRSSEESPLPAEIELARVELIEQLGS